LLGDKTAKSLVYTIYFYIGKIFGLRACEHRQLRLSNFIIENNNIYLKDLKKKPRMVTHYCHEDEESVHEPCLVQMFKQYISLVSELPKIYESFYFRPSKTAYKFENAPIGIHKLNSIVPFLLKEAGLEIKTAHCLRVTTATNLFRAGHQEKLIRERTGHVSSALFTFEKPSNDQAMAVSKCVGPSVSKVVSLVVNCFKPCTLEASLRKTKSFKFPTRNLISF
jgi:integrase